MNLAKLFKWLLFDQYMFHMAEGDAGGPGDDDDDGDADDGDGDGDGDGEGITATWPEDWRVQIAGEDEKALKQLGRYQSPADIWTKARALEQRITSGELKDYSPFPEKGSDDDKAAWRANNQIPEAPGKYELGREVGEE